MSLSTPAAVVVGDAQLGDSSSMDQPAGVEDTKNGVLQTLPPSHILEDGRLIYLPPPNALERTRFFERSIARHGLLQADMEKSETEDKKVQNLLNSGDEEKSKDNADGDETTKDKTALKIHPLAIASARLQSNGLNELNRAINLATLVNSGEFFSYTNVVDPSLEADAAPKDKADTAHASSDTAQVDAATAQKTEALFSLKRKRSQFETASRVLQRHESRLYAGIRAQKVIDRRLFQLRQHWRLVAPEHGTRAKLHAARTNEVIAVDVDVYDRDRVHGGNQALMGGSNKSRIGLAGRLASRVPRFATIELRDDFKVPKWTKDEDDANDSSNEDETKDVEPTKQSDHEMKDAEEGKDQTDNKPADDKTDSTPTEHDGGDTVMNDADANPEDTKDDTYAAKWTRAEPFAIADPTLGRVLENFDPSKIPMLNLQLDIQKSSTGFLQSAFLEPMTTLSSDNQNHENDAKNNNNSNTDEELLISLQHSLFCANLFESMRGELDPNTDLDTAAARSPSSFTVRRPKAVQSMAWLASESEENFVAPPSFLVGTDAGRGLAPLSVVHCHEGEVKVQLDSEYQLCLKLVEANAEQTVASSSKLVKDIPSANSGTQSPERLHAFCRALLLYAQDVYHKHSLYLHDREKKLREDEIAKGDQPRGLARIKKEDAPEKARILQSCVSLGSKMLFEQRIRKALKNVAEWLTTEKGERLVVEWLPLSIFDLHSKFVICCRQLVLDGILSRDDLTMTKITEDEDYRKVHFRTEKEFELYLKLELQRELRR